MLLRIPLVFLLILLRMMGHGLVHITRQTEGEIVDDQSDGTVSCVDVNENNLVKETASEVQVGYDNDELQNDDTVDNELQDRLLNIKLSR